MNNTFPPSRFTTLIYKIVLLFILFIGVGNISNELYAQPVSVEIKDFNMRAERADSCLVALENTVLIVRLPTYRKKIARLERIENNNKLSSKQRNRAAKQKQQQLDDLEKLNEVMFKGMYEHYDFSDFLITNDTLWDDFLAGTHEGIFYNEQQELDPSISYTDTSFLVLHYGKTDYGTTNNQTGFIVADSNLKDLEDPFPYYFVIVDKLRSLGKIFSSQLNVYIPPVIVQIFNDRLFRASNQVPIREENRKIRNQKKENQN